MLGRATLSVRGIIMASTTKLQNITITARPRYLLLEQNCSFDQKCKALNWELALWFKQVVLPCGLISLTCRSTCTAILTFTMMTAIFGCCLCEPSSASNFATAQLSINCQRRPRRTNCKQHFEVAHPHMSNSLFCYSLHYKYPVSNMHVVFGT